MILPEDRDMRFGIEVRKSTAIWDIAYFIRDEVITMDELEGFSEGLVLQDATIWKKFPDKDLIPKNNMTELYFEEPDIEGFVKKLEESEFEIESVNELMTHSWGKRL